MSKDCCQNGEIKPFLFGGHCQECTHLDEEALQNNWHPPLFVIQTFLSKYMKLLYRTFHGDLTMAIVMCEIWQYNLGRYFSRSGSESCGVDLGHPERRQSLLPPCNTYSISQSLGVPNETVRRKVKKLIGLGWVHRNDNGELTSTVASEERYLRDDIIEFTREFASHARHALALLGNGEIPPSEKSFETKQDTPEKP